jgi:glycosyltransferase involved in cell wall biosynthesis
MKILTLASVFPNPQQPVLGLFIRERMRHVGQRAEVRVVAPIPVSPLDPLARRRKPGYRSVRPSGERMDHGLRVTHPGVLCFPGFLKSLDPFFFYRSLLGPLKRLKKDFPFQVIDAHFAYPEGVAAALLGRRLKVPFIVTLRGNEFVYARSALRAPQIRWAFRRAARVVGVSESLARIARELGAREEQIRVVPNGVDLDRFRPLDRKECRRRLGLPEKATILLSVGALVKRKGFHRVIEVLPALKASVPDLVFVAVGSSSVEGDMSGELKAQVARLGLEDSVRFEGQRSPEELASYYPAADLFVLATWNEGWCNVFLESLACGTPVVTTDVGGNREVIKSDALGMVVPFGDPDRLQGALAEGLRKEWRREDLVRYAEERSWQRVGDRMLEIFEEVRALHLESACAE